MHYLSKRTDTVAAWYTWLDTVCTQCLQHRCPPSLSLSIFSIVLLHQFPRPLNSSQQYFWIFVIPPTDRSLQHTSVHWRATLYRQIDFNFFIWMHVWRQWIFACTVGFALRIWSFSKVQSLFQFLLSVRQAFDRHSSSETVFYRVRLTFNSYYLHLCVFLFLFSNW